MAKGQGLTLKMRVVFVCDHDGAIVMVRLWHAVHMTVDSIMAEVRGKCGHTVRARRLCANASHRAGACPGANVSVIGYACF